MEEPIMFRRMIRRGEGAGPRRGLSFILGFAAATLLYLVAPPLSFAAKPVPPAAAPGDLKTPAPLTGAAARVWGQGLEEDLSAAQPSSGEEDAWATSQTPVEALSTSLPVEPEAEPALPSEPQGDLVSEFALSRTAAENLPFWPLKVDQTLYDALPRKGKGVMCIAGHLKPNDLVTSPYLSQCAYALQRWHEVFQAAGGKYLNYKLAVVTDRARFNHQIKIDPVFKKFTQEALTTPIFIDDWTVGELVTPQVKFGRMKMPQSSKFQGFPQLWVHKFEAFARSPFETTMFIDYDTHACLGAEQLFESYAAVDVAPMACKFMCWGGTRQNRNWGLYAKQYEAAGLLATYAEINEPLTAGIMMNTANPLVTYLNLVARDIYIGSMREVGNPIKHDQPALREAVFLAGHLVNHTRIDEYVGCDFKVARKCENKCHFVHGKMTLDPVVSGGQTQTSWASRIGARRRFY